MHFLLITLFLCVFLEGTFTSIPLTLIALLVIAVANRDTSVFPLAFITGTALDILLLRPLGATGVFFILYFLLVFLYQRKYEISTAPFVLFSSFFGTVVYAKFFGVEYLFISAAVSTIAAALLFRGALIVLGSRSFSRKP